MPAAMDSGIQSSLSTKISVIVFWGMIVIGLLASFLLLRGLENEIASLYSAQSSEYIHELEQYVDHDKSFTWEGLRQKAQALYPVYGIRRVVIVSGEVKFVFGEPAAEQLLPLSHEFFYHGVNDSRRSQGVVEVTTYFTPLEHALADRRKTILVFMGAILLVFGLFLYSVLQKVLSRPFLQMVQTAKSITQGETALRFQEDRMDEFGFLARFINKALDFVTLKQRELQVALDKVRKSEMNLLDEKTRIEVTLHSIGDAVITTDEEGRIRYLNPVAETLLDCGLNDVHGKPVWQVLHMIDEEQRRPVESPVEACLRDGRMVETVEQVLLVRPDGSEMEVASTASPIRGKEDGLLIGTVLVLHDVSRARKMARQLSYQASHDDLTGLVNRREFERVLTKVVNEAEPEVKEHTLCYMDLDQFKIVNDTCGHIAGDELLRQFAALVRGKIRDTDIVARLGGDEFGILFHRCNAEVARRIAESLLARVREYRFTWQDFVFDVGVSIGLVSVTSSGQGITEIMSAADVACYSAKEAGRNRVHLYHMEDDELKQRHGEMRWVSRLSKALEEDRFCLYCQKIVPVTDTGNSRPHYELLIRLLDEEGKLVPPLAFIPSAERYNLMSSIDRWVVRKAFETFAAKADMVSGWKFSINLSGQSLCDDSFLKFVIDTFEDSGVSPEQICFEITETTAMTNLSRATRFISVLKGMGCEFSLDDFGTGLSSFGYLQALKVNYLKIDGTFVRDMVGNSVNRAVVEAANQIGHAMGIQTIAEFVENDEIIDILRRIGVNYAQGYGVAKPVPMDEIFSEADQPVRRRTVGT